MNQDNSCRSDWYAPPRRAAAPPPPPPPPIPPRKKHTGLKVAALSVCVLLLLVASVYAFSDSFGLHWPFRAPAEAEGDPGITAEVPGAGEKATPPESTPKPASDNSEKSFRDFFSKYYVVNPNDDKGPIDVQRAESGTSFRLTLASAKGRREQTLQTLYPECLQSIVAIRTVAAGQRGYYLGSGVIMSEDGYILTNRHLLEGTDTAYVTLPDDTEGPALMVGEDESTDLCVLKIEASGLHPAEFGDSGELAVGDSVFAIGNPMEMSLRGTLSSGIVSGIARNISVGSHTMTLIQTTTPINEGNSGGALFNMYGQVIGITNMKFVNPYSDVQVEGLGFAIPSATAKVVTDHLLAEGVFNRPGIGITVGELSAEDAEQNALPKGLYISSVSAGSDAEAKGIRSGDVLTHVNGTQVLHSGDVLALRDMMQIGETMTLTIFRDGETFDVEIELMNLNDLY